MRYIISPLVGFGLSFSSLASAQTMNVSIEASVRDDIGKQLASRVRQKIASSPLMTYISDDGVASLRLRLTTLDPDESQSQNYTVYSEVLVFHPKDGDLESYLTDSVGTCGRNKVEQCANSLVADIDEWAEVLRKAAKK